jgi:cytochrome P450
MMKRKADEQSTTTAGNFTTIFDVLLEHNPENHSDEKRHQELIDQAFVYVIAGIDTTSYTISASAYYILSSPSVLTRLRGELDEATLYVDGMFDWRQARQLPYLLCPSI